MLAMLDRATRERLVFPLGDLRKDDVRAMRARAAGLPAADAVESQEVCFVGEGGYVPFLERTGGPRPAPGADRGRAPAGAWARTGATGASRSASGGGSASPAPNRSTCSPPTPCATP